MPLSAGRLLGYRQQRSISCELRLELGVVLPAESRWSWQTVRCNPSSHITTSTCHDLLYMKCTVSYSGWIQVSTLWICDWDLLVLSGAHCDVFTVIKSCLGPETARLINRVSAGLNKSNSRLVKTFLRPFWTKSKTYTKYERVRKSAVLELHKNNRLFTSKSVAKMLSNGVQNSKHRHIQRWSWAEDGLNVTWMQDGRSSAEFGSRRTGWPWNGSGKWTYIFKTN